MHEIIGIMLTTFGDRLRAEYDYRYKLIGSISLGSGVSYLLYSDLFLFLVTAFIFSNTNNKLIINSTLAITIYYLFFDVFYWQALLSIGVATLLAQIFYRYLDSYNNNLLRGALIGFILCILNY